MLNTQRRRFVRRSTNWFSCVLLLCLLCIGVPAQQKAAPPTTAELRTARYFESVRQQPSLLLAFLKEMPKGADLHNHLSGSIYAESYVKWAAAAHLCVDEQTLVIVSPPCEVKAHLAPMEQAFADIVLYRRLVDAWSMRNWEQSGQSAHDHFFDAFAKFGRAASMWTGEMLADVTAQASRDRVSYLELIFTPDGSQSSMLGSRVGWDDDFSKLREKLLGAGLRDAIAAGQRNLDEAEKERRSLLKCNATQADPGCHVTARYIYQVLRANSREQVFAQILAGFEMASVDSRVVGLNLVQPEDWYVPMRDFSLHMRMLDYLHQVYPKVHISLHAGELAYGLVPPEGLQFHIRESIEGGHAERIGHGVSIMEESDPLSLLREMSARNVMVEICLTSNDLILGLRGHRHPLSTYLQYSVPVGLATDDEGVSRSDMTREYLRAAQDQGLDYLVLKKMARTTLEHAFIEGRSLWNDSRHFKNVSVCQLGRQNPISTDCRRFLDGSTKARLQWDLEAAFTDFERKY
jgi:adenosine deaminase